MKRTHQVALLLLLLFSMTQLGCSVIGYAIGSGIDYSIAPEVELPDASKLNKGDVLKLVWVDGDEDVATIQAVEDDSVTIVYVSHGQRITTTLKDISRESWLIAVTKLEPGHAGRGFSRPPA